MADETMSQPTPEQLAAWNALAAEKLEGWRWMRCMQHGEPSVYRTLAPPDEATRWPADGSEYVIQHSFPGYATDLNAVARLEALVRERGLRLELYRSLFDIVGCSVGVVYATAAQRLEAVLRCCGLLEGE